STEIDEFAVLVKRQLVATSLNVGDNLRFELVVAAIDGAIALEYLVRGFPRNAALERQRWLGDTLHLIFDCGEIIGRDLLPLRHVDVVIEPSFDGRTNC